MNKRLNTLSVILYTITWILGLGLIFISIGDPTWFPIGFVVFVIGMFLFFIAWESREKMSWRDRE